MSLVADATNSLDLEPVWIVFTGFRTDPVGSLDADLDPNEEVVSNVFPMLYD